MYYKNIIKKWKYIIIFLSALFLSMVIGYFIKYILNSNETFLYFSGIFLQICGISIMLMHIYKLNKNFNKKSKLNPKNIIQKRETKEHSVSGTINIAYSIHGEVEVIQAPKDESVESRIESLRKDFNFQFEQLKSAISEKDKNINKFKNQMNSRIDKITKDHIYLNKKLKSVMTDTNDWLTLSYIWTLIGLLFIIFA